MNNITAFCGGLVIVGGLVAIPSMAVEAGYAKSKVKAAVAVANSEYSGIVVGETAGSEEGLEASFVPVTQEGMEWLNTPPPTDVQTVGLKSEDGAMFVGIVYPPATKDGDPVSSTVVAMTKPGTDPATLTGVVLVDPKGNKHNVTNGEVITFTATTLGLWKLFNKAGEQVASCEVKLNEKVAELYGQAPMEDPVVCKAGTVIDAPSAGDGIMGNTKVTGGKLLAENPRSKVLAVDSNMKAGRNEISIEDGPNKTTVPVQCVTINVTGPREMVIGQAGLMKITVGGLGGMTQRQRESIGKMLAVRYRNATPQIVSFGAEEGGHKMVDTSGESFVLDVPFQAVTAGRFQINAWTTKPPLGGTGVYCQGFQCCTTACAPCSSSWGFCDDRGRTNCTRIGGRTGTHCLACQGGVCNHIGSSACGHWWCACPFGFCAC